LLLVCQVCLRDGVPLGNASPVRIQGLVVLCGPPPLDRLVDGLRVSPHVHDLLVCLRLVRREARLPG
ncbi:Histidine kinase, partial [Dysosmobacter welbionis]